MTMMMMTMAQVFTVVKTGPGKPHLPPSICFRRDQAQTIPPDMLAIAHADAATHQAQPMKSDSFSNLNDASAKHSRWIVRTYAPSRRPGARPSPGMGARKRSRPRRFQNKRTQEAVPDASKPYTVALTREALLKEQRVPGTAASDKFLESCDKEFNVVIRLSRSVAV